MTEHEKELIEFIRHEYSKALVISTVPAHIFTHLAKALIKRYPQILAEKVWEGDVKDVCMYSGNKEFFDREKVKNIEVFIREVKE